MLFSSIPFLYYFLPCVLLIYFIVPECLKNFILLMFSLIFYAWGEPKYVVLMAVSVVVGYVSGLLLEKYQNHQVRKVILVISAAVCVGMLGYFKYADFLISNYNAITGFSVPLLKIALPIGISFYMFQILSYMADVYRGHVKAQKNLITFASYVSLFPQLIAGPIIRYCDVEKQLIQRTHSLENAAIGIRRFILGLGKKVLIANALGELCEIFRTSQEQSVLFYWLYAVSFTLHIYFDFSGYSDMAIGLGRIFGFSFLENFNYPYIASSITDFWRRWHMSLGYWFRDYVYIPLGGNQVSKGRWVCNILLVWMLTGFWHGAAWNFIIWGLYFAVLLIIEKSWLQPYLKKTKIIKHTYVLFLIIISFVIFNAVDMNQAANDLAGMFGGKDLPLVSTEFFYYLKSYAVVLIIAIIGATPFPVKIISRWKQQIKIEKLINLAEPFILAGLLLVITAYLVDGSFNPFLYFRF